MGFDDEDAQHEETGSDELLSSDTLRLPEDASVLVRLHAVRAWLTRRQAETRAEFGEAAMSLQQIMQQTMREPSPQVRRRKREGEQRLQIQQTLASTQRRLQAYEDAEELFEDCIDHTTTGERALVEYYLTLDTLIQEMRDDATLDGIDTSARLAVFTAVLSRVEHVGSISHAE